MYVKGLVKYLIANKLSIISCHYSVIVVSKYMPINDSAKQSTNQQVLIDRLRSV